MSAARLIVRRATLVVRPVYTCSSCGMQQMGSAATLAVDTPPNLADWFATQGVGNTHMPEGWAGYGLYVHRCPACTARD